ncbi:MAG: ribonuclease H [Bacteroidales bacterium]|nr:ribonuclease H [Bacteroidales bacterium]
MATRQTIYLYTDGAASGNPGPGGWGAVLVCGTHRKELSGGYRLTTNNRMELLAVIRGLEAIKWKDATVRIYSDSTYVVKTVTENWKRKKNQDLWARFDAVRAGFNLEFNWIKGHAGHPENERCDRLAVKAYSEGVLEEDNAYVESIETENICRTGKLL